MTKKLVLSVVLSTATVLLVSACGGSSGAQAGSTDQQLTVSAGAVSTTFTSLALDFASVV